VRKSTLLFISEFMSEEESRLIGHHTIVVLSHCILRIDK